MFTYFIGLDLGEVRDYTAIAVLRRREVIEPSNVYLEQYHIRVHQDEVAVTTFELVHLERLKIGTTYPMVIDHVERLLGSAELAADRVLVVDASGVGKPIVEALQQRGISPLVPVTIVGGQTVSDSPDGGYRVPRSDIIGVLQLHIQNGRLKFAAGLPDIETLVAEISGMRVKPTKVNDSDTIQWRESPHDDLAFAIGVSLWYGSRFQMERPLFEGTPEQPAWDPLRWEL